MRDVWLKIAGTSSAKVYYAVVGLAILIITARWLGPEGRGVIAAAMAWATLFATVAHLSLGHVAVHRATRLRGTPWLGTTLGSLLLLAGIISVAGWVVASGIYVATDGSLYGGLVPIVLLVSFLALPFHVWEQYGSSLLMAVDRIDIYNRAQVAGRTLSLLLVLGLLWMGFGATGVLAAILAGQVVIGSSGVRFLWQHAQVPIRPEPTAVRELMKGGMKLHLNAIGAFIIFATDVIMLNYYRGVEEVGQYQLGVSLITVTVIVPQASSMVLYAQVAKLGPDAAWKQQKRILFFVTGGILGAALAGAALAPWAIPFAVGVAFAPAVEIFQILLLSLVGMTFSAIMAPQWIGRGLFLQASAISFVMVSINLVGNFILIPIYGMHGTAWATVVAFGFAVLANGAMAIWVSRRPPGPQQREKEDMEASLVDYAKDFI